MFEVGSPPPPPFSRVTLAIPGPHRGAGRKSRGDSALNGHKSRLVAERSLKEEKIPRKVLSI